MSDFLVLFRWGRLVIDVMGGFVLVRASCNIGLVSLPHLHKFVISTIEPRGSYVNIDVVGVVGSLPNRVYCMQLATSIHVASA